MKIIEILPINFLLRSSKEQYNIISSFASWLKISPMRLQFKSVSRKADSDKHVAMVREELSRENDPQCRQLGEEYLRLIKDVGNKEALSRRFFLIFQYEPPAGKRNSGESYADIYSMIQTAVQNAKTYFMQCGNAIVQPEDEDVFTAEVLYMFFNRSSCCNEPFQSRVERVVVDTMQAKGKIIGLDAVPHIRPANFIAPRGIDFSHYNFVVMDGMYYSVMYIRRNGFPHSVRGGWMSSLINAGEGIDVDVFLRRENRGKTLDKVAQRIRLNRTKLRGMQDTSTDYEKKAQRNILTSGAASTYMFTSFEMSDDSGVLLGMNRHNNSLCIVDLFNTKVNKNANVTLLGTSGAGKTFTMQLLALRMRMRGIQCYILAPLKGHEFKRACNAVGGAYIKISPGSSSCINVMEIRKT